ncbi:MAG TPA: hypothetical protein VFG75_03420 [Gaiella sp.]|nr:hypothetical protein [Gaiella sp.]
MEERDERRSPALQPYGYRDAVRDAFGECLPRIDADEAVLIVDGERRLLEECERGEAVDRRVRVREPGRVEHPDDITVANVGAQGDPRRLGQRNADLPSGPCAGP